MSLFVPLLEFNPSPSFPDTASRTITALSLQRALQPGKMSLFCALPEAFYTVEALLQ
jgi:hypothetical protein